MENTKFANLQMIGTYLDEDVPKLNGNFDKIDNLLQQGSAERDLEKETRQQETQELQENLVLQGEALQNQIVEALAAIPTLSDSITSASTTTAANSKAVKSVNDALKAKLPMLTGAGAVGGVYPVGGFISNQQFETTTPVSFTLPNYGTWLVLETISTIEFNALAPSLRIRSGGYRMSSTASHPKLYIYAFRIA